MRSGQQPEVAERYARRFPWLLVDEFQDTNRVQFDLLKQLTTSKQQRVRGRRSGPVESTASAAREVRNILEFEDQFPRHLPDVVAARAELPPATRTILRAAEPRDRQQQGQRKHKSLRTDNEGRRAACTASAPGGPAEEARCDRRPHPCRCTARARPLDQIAVFYRAHAPTWLSLSLEQAYEGQGHPRSEIIGGLTFFERREIKDLLGLPARACVNPLDDVSMATASSTCRARVSARRRSTSCGRRRDRRRLSLREAVADPGCPCGARPPRRRTAC